MGEFFQESSNSKQQILMSVVESKLHLPVAHKVAPSDADMAPQFDLGKAPNIYYLFNVAAVTVCEHLCAQNQAVTITVIEQPGLAPGFNQINRAATRSLCLTIAATPATSFEQCSDVHTTAAASEALTVRIYFAQLDPTNSCGRS